MIMPDPIAEGGAKRGAEEKELASIIVSSGAHSCHVRQDDLNDRKFHRRTNYGEGIVRILLAMIGMVMQQAMGAIQLLREQNTHHAMRQNHGGECQ